MTTVEPARSPGVRVAGVLLVVAAVGYPIVEAVVASAWTSPHYSYLENLVPSLGSTTCGPTNGQAVCSPLHPLMNAMFVVHGLLFGTAWALLARAARIRLRRVVLPACVAYAIGLTAITVFHHAEGMPVIVRVLNILGAFVGILAGGAVAIAVGLRPATWSLPRWVGVASVALGAVGILAGVVFFALSIGPPGLRERVSIYPLLLWQLLLGASLASTPGPIRGRIPAEHPSAQGRDTAPVSGERPTR